MAKCLYDAIKNRRSIYHLDKDISIPDVKIKEIVDTAVQHTPSAFNSQSGRVLLLIGKHHDKLWDITKEELRKVVPEDKFQPTAEKIDSFRSGYGTVLFFEDQDVVKGLQEKFSLYKDNFPIWSEHASGMLQYVVWTALANEGVGASLQHYNPLIDDEVRKQWDIPDTWKLRAQMPFGNIVSQAGEKEVLPLQDRVKVFK